jgi:5-deoxy-glucuronate isomerase
MSQATQGAVGRETLYQGENLRLERLNLAPGDQYTVRAAPGLEAGLVLLSGRVRLDGREASRKDVFSERATAALVPGGTSLRVEAVAESELVLVETSTEGLPGEDAPAPVIVGPEDVIVNPRGRLDWTREVHDILMSQVPARRLLLGETINGAGQWSSFPPHKHDGEDGEPYLEEVYYYKVLPREGFGVQCLYRRGQEQEAFIVRDGSVVGIPRGYHPVGAAPGHKLYYLWALAGEQHKLALHEDPDFTWLHQAEREEFGRERNVNG